MQIRNEKIESLEDILNTKLTQLPKSLQKYDYLDVDCHTEYSDEAPTGYFVDNIEVEQEHYEKVVLISNAFAMLERLKNINDGIQTQSEIGVEPNVLENDFARLQGELEDIIGSIDRFVAEENLPQESQLDMRLKELEAELKAKNQEDSDLIGLHAYVLQAQDKPPKEKIIYFFQAMLELQEYYALEGNEKYSHYLNEVTNLIELCLKEIDDPKRYGRIYHNLQVRSKILQAIPVDLVSELYTDYKKLRNLVDSGGCIELRGKQVSTEMTKQVLNLKQVNERIDLLIERLPLVEANPGLQLRHEFEDIRDDLYYQAPIEFRLNELTAAEYAELVANKDNCAKVTVRKVELEHSARLNLIRLYDIRQAIVNLDVIGFNLESEGFKKNINNYIRSSEDSKNIPLTPRVLLSISRHVNHEYFPKYEMLVRLDNIRRELADNFDRDEYVTQYAAVTELMQDIMGAKPYDLVRSIDSFVEAHKDGLDSASFMMKFSCVFTGGSTALDKVRGVVGDYKKEVGVELGVGFRGPS